MKIVILAVFLLSLFQESIGAPRAGKHELKLTVSRLHGKYYDIFKPPRANRNAASHLWARYVLERSKRLTKDELLHVFGGFCPVSGSPVNPSTSNLYTGLKVKRASSEEYDFVNVHVCCWPCTCDIQDFVRTDPLKVKVKSDVGEKIVQHTFQALVIGDPCSKPDKIPRSAPAVVCKDGKLQDAVLSKNGHVVIGLTQPESRYLKYSKASYMKASYLSGRCESRKKAGYQSGMGKIFLEVASISPIE